MAFDSVRGRVVLFGGNDDSGYFGNTWEWRGNAWTLELSAKAGNVSIALTNSSPVEHDVKIESSSGATVGGLEPFTGGTKTLTANLKPGTYKFFCSVPGHRQAGMEGTLTVK